MDADICPASASTPSGANASPHYVIDTKGQVVDVGGTATVDTDGLIQTLLWLTTNCPASDGFPDWASVYRDYLSRRTGADWGLREPNLWTIGSAT
jgi:hypothetical protein